MRDTTLMAMLCFVMLFGSLALRGVFHRIRCLLDERKLTLNFCVKTTCNYFNPEYGICYCCPDDSHKEYCHLKLEDCRANCATCRPKCS
ncbi:hypothetical protein PVAP13_5NG385834 [Panicum virgatum]|uniref:Uncharacterized protein n=1 Tax=Panicum virgatum TaxID=38727 RepID=A0A8T0RVZ8_PANVG|nr:hypothetical protein PVAP13_5NG385834 [Panicum virgatum]